MNRIDVVNLLLSSGASVNIVSSYGATALDWGIFNSLFISINLYNIYYIATAYSHSQVMNILKAAGGITYVY
jgi:ankyrin repeat protein